MTLANPETGELVPTITRDEAMRLTAEIKGHAGQIWRLLSKAHETHAYLALDYLTFEEYVEVEFEMSKSQAYRLLDKARIVADLNAGMIAASWNVSDGESPMGDIPERHARELVPLAGDPEKVAEAYVEAVENAEAEGRNVTSADIRVTVEQRKPKEPAPTSPAVQAIRERRAREAAEKAQAAGTSVEAQEAERLAREQYLIDSALEAARLAYVAATTACAQLLKQNADFTVLAVVNEPLDRKELARFATDMGEWCKAVKKELSINVRSVPKSE